MKKMLLPALALLLLAACARQTDNPRVLLKFTDQWRFSLADSALDASAPGFDHSQWRTLDLPHDWSIEGEFKEENPAKYWGGALPGGIGWYRKTFRLDPSDKGKRISLIFDGVYMCSEVFVNGKSVGKRPNGYISFAYDITEQLLPDQENTVAVRVDNSRQPNSRWYSGSGIYRNVWLLKTNDIRVAQWGTFVTTPQVDATQAQVRIQTSIKSQHPSAQNLVLRTSIVDAQGKEVAQTSSDFSLEPNQSYDADQSVTLPNPALWTLEAPALYTAVSELLLDDQLYDRYETTFGVRKLEFDSKKGFALNGKPTKILGVCMHHDLGALGAAVNTRAIERQLEIMKAMGANAIRTSHNPPAPELLQLCDRMGLLVMDETFDVWAKKKVDYDYATYWHEWYERDLRDHVLRDRNHPSVILWSIGNEIGEQWDTVPTPITAKLLEIVNRHDGTRLVTTGNNNPNPSNSLLKSDVLEMVGFNYNHDKYEQVPTNFPGKLFIATETHSSLHTRGAYNFPADTVRVWPHKWDELFLDGNPDLTCSAFDNCRAPWGSTHEDTWRLAKKLDFVSGLFIWTGFDYLGEPTPYAWPARSSYFGLVDLAGFPKDAYYFYQSEWSKQEVLHLFPHWNWTAGQEVDVWAYTNFAEVELFLNDKSLGTARRQGDKMHLQWKVPFAPGTLTAKARRANGSLLEVSIKTAAEPARIQLLADRQAIQADGLDLAFVTVNILDKDGNLVPTANNRVEFQLSPNASIAGVDNGHQTSLEPFKATYRKAFNGKCLAIVQASRTAGTATLTATSPGLESAQIEITLR